jgi:hypothetical protein
MALSLFARLDDGKAIASQKVGFAAMKPGPGKKGRALLEQIEVPETVLNAAKDLGAERFVLSARKKRKGHALTGYAQLRQYAGYLAQMRQELLTLYDNAPLEESSEEKEEGSGRGGNEDAIRLRYALSTYARTHNNVQSWRSYEKCKIVELRGPAHVGSEIPQGAYKGRSNSRLDIYQDENLEMGWEVITRLNEMKKIPPKWQSLPNSRPLFSLRKDDEVEMKDKSGNVILARVQNLSQGDVSFCPIEVAVNDQSHPKMIRIKSLKAWKSLGIVPIARTPLGQEKYRGKLRNI